MFNQNKSYELTTAQLKKYEGFENVTEEEAKAIIFQLKELSLILFKIFEAQSDRGCLPINNSNSTKDDDKKHQAKSRVSKQPKI